jgi:Na+-transporting methylmalonyl-CoA/oxaloacetate decarboxylase gamma subunit
MTTAFTQSLKLMGQGMAGIFAVIVIIYLVIVFLGRPPKHKDK